MRICLSLLAALCALSLLAVGTAPAGEKADVRIDPAARKPDKSDKKAAAKPAKPDESDKKAAVKPAKTENPPEKSTLEFIDTPAKDVVAYVARRGKLNIVIDPTCAKLMETKLTFKAEGMKLGQVLDWALRLAGAERQFKDGVIYVTPKGKEKKVDALKAAREILLKEKDGVFLKPAEFKPPPEVTLPVIKK